MESRATQFFISYSSKDFAWVTENLISLVEKHSISFSFDNRDFELGRPITQNMENNVYASRHVLIVLSNNYLASNFCRKELQMAAQKGVDKGDPSVILVKINKFKKTRLPRVLRKTNLLDFGKHKGKQDWEEKLLHVLMGGETVTHV